MVRATLGVRVIEGIFVMENIVSRRVTFYEATECTKLDGNVTFKSENLDKPCQG